MKKVLLSLVLLASISFGVSAQGRDGGHRGGDMNQGLKELNLTADQQQKINSLSADFKAKSETLKNEQIELRKKHRGDVMAILTPEQQAKWKAQQEKGKGSKNRKGKKSEKGQRGTKQMNSEAVTPAK